MSDTWDSIDIGNEINDLMSIKNKIEEGINRTNIRIEKYRKEAAAYKEAYELATDGHNADYLKWHHTYSAEHQNSIELLEQLEESYRSLENRIKKLTS